MKSLKLILIALTLACAITSAHGQIFLVNFGANAPTGNSKDGSGATVLAINNSPYQAANGTIPGAVWNTIGLTGTTATSLTTSTGTTTGVTLVEGYNSNTGGANAWTPGNNASITLGNDGTNTKSSGLGTVDNSGIYTGNSVGKGGIFESNFNLNNSIGAQIGGLSAGTYQIYITARNTNNNLSYNELVYAGSTSSAGAFTYSSTGTLAATGFSEQTLSYSGANNVTSWVSGGNTAVLTVNLAVGQYLDIAVGESGTNNNEYRGFLNSLEIVQTSTVPEPTTSVLLGLSLAFVLATYRQRPFRFLP